MFVEDASELSGKGSLNPVALRAAVDRGIVSPCNLAKGARITLEVTNLFDTRQRARDDNGATPSRYHPCLPDPWGPHGLPDPAQDIPDQASDPVFGG